MKILKFLVAIFVILAGFSALAVAAIDKYYYVAPAEIVQYIQDKPGKRVVMVYASWCPYCRQAMPTMIEIGEAKKNSVIAISIDKEPEKLVDYLGKLGEVPFHAFVAKQEYDGELASQLQDLGIKLKGGIPFMALLREDGSIEAQGNLRAEDVKEYMMSD